MRHRANWLQLLRFAVVGTSGYVLNLAVFAFAVKVAEIDYRLAATLAFLAAVTNNFWWNRHWTFEARDHGRIHFQAVRFFTVSVVAFLVGLGILHLLVEVADQPEVRSQALAILAVTPLSFIGNKLWTFGQRSPDELRARP